MPRTKLVFRGTYDFYVYGDYFIMDGFRFNGTVSKKSELLVKNNIELSGGSGNAGVATLAVANRDYFDILQQNTWFAAFACINDDRPNQTCFYRTVPFLRVHSVSGNKLFLAQYMGRDYTGIGNKANLSWDTSALIGKEILICSETFPGTRTNHPSGRITKITAADNESITVEEAGTISEFDYVLPAPDAKYFHYCGSVYFDTAAIMNFADTGTHVGTRSVNIYTTVPTGAVTTGTTVNCHGHISPLATAIVINNSVGSYLKTPFGFNELFEDGGLHTVAYVGGVVDTFRDTMLTVPFIFGQRFVYKTSGTDAKYRNSHKMLVLGYIEP